MRESRNKAAAAYWATMSLLVLLALWFLIGGRQLVLIMLPALSVTFAGFSIWLTVRIINRRERRTKRTVVALVISLLVAYPLSFFVVATILFFMEAPPSGIAKELLSGIYSPLIWIFKENRFVNWLFDRVLTSATGFAMASAGVLAAGVVAVRAVLVLVRGTSADHDIQETKIKLPG